MFGVNGSRFNIVEGCGASSQKEFARFLGIAIKSTKGLESELELAHAYTVLAEHDWEDLGSSDVSVGQMLYRLRAKVLATIGEAPATDPNPKTRKSRTRKTRKNRKPVTANRQLRTLQ